MLSGLENACYPMRELCIGRAIALPEPARASCMRGRDGSGPRRVAGFSISARYLGAAVLREASSPFLRPTRISERATERLELARLAAWSERVILKHASNLAVLMADDDEPHRDVLVDVMREVAARQKVALLEVSRFEIARTFCLRESTNAALCSRVLEQHPDIARELGRRGVRSFLGPRSEAARYWTTPVLALGAAFHAYELMNRPMP